MDRLFNPHSIAVIGVSDQPNNLGKIIVQNLLRFGFPGELTLIGRNHATCDGLPILTMDEFPEGIDLAIILTPAATVPAYLEMCGKKKVAYVILESGGFAEFSENGKQLEQECLDIARKYQSSDPSCLRLVGPNCIGISNPSKGILTNFIPTQKDELLPGRVAIMAQSGGVVMTCGDILIGGGLGISKTVSMGNKIDLQEAEYLEYFLNDPETDIVFIYLESIQDGRRLVELARGSLKPIMIYKSNTSPASAVAAASHTAALANDELVLDAALWQAGILRLQSLKELLASSQAFSMPPMRGNRLAVFSRSGGFGIVAADLASDFGFELPPFNQAVLDTLRPYLRVNIMQENNPLDLGTVFDFDSFPIILEACIKEMHPDGMMLVFNYRRQDFEKSRQVFQKLATLSHSYQIPIALVVFTEMDEVHNLEKTLGYPVFCEVSDAMQGLAAWRSVNSRLRIQSGPAVESKGKSSTERAGQILAICRSENRHPYLHEALEICQAYGLPVAPWVFVENARQVVQSASQIDFPLVLKVVSGSVSHKTEAGGVVLNIKDPIELEQAIQGMENRLSSLGLADQVKGFVLQKMLPAGRELILGGKRDPAFGPVLLVGLGGIFVEVLRDTALRLAPITPQEAHQMINDLRGRQYLDEIRGQPAADLELLTNCLVRLSQIITGLPDIQEIDINPMLLYSQGGAVVDARIGLRLDRPTGKN